MTRLTIRQQIYAFIGIAAAVIFVIIFFVIFPAVQSIRDLQRTIKETHTFLESRYQAIQKVKKSVEVLSEVEEDTVIFSQAIIRPGLELEFITQLEKLSERHHMDQQLSASLIKDASVASLRKQKDRPYYAFTFLNRGTFADHVAYFRELEQAPFYLIIDRLVLEKETNKDKKEEIIARFDGFMYAAHQ